MIKKTMLMCIICLIGYFSVFADGFTPQDIEELETAGQEEVFGGGINASLIGTMYYNAYSLGIGTGFQAGSIARITAEVQILLKDSYEGLMINAGVSFGAPPSNNTIRIYGGPQASFVFFLDESFQAGLGGKGGMEFFVNHLTASFIEFGGIAPLYSSNTSHKMQSFFFCGGFRLFL